MSRYNNRNNNNNGRGGGGRSSGGGRENQNNQKESTTKNSVPKDNSDLVWSMELPLPDGGVIRVQANDSYSLLAAYPGMLALGKAVQCNVCQSTDVKLTEKKMDGGWTAYLMRCQVPDCGAYLSLQSPADYQDMAIISYKEEFSDWIKSEKRDNDNSRDNSRSNSRGDGNRSGGSSGRGGGRSSGGSSNRGGGRGRQQEQDDNYDDQGDPNDDVPF